MEILSKVGGLVVLAAISAVLYRAGGLDKETKHWIPIWLRNSWVRDWLCPLCSYSALLLFWQPFSFLGWGLLLPSYALLGVSLSTYWDWLFKFDNYWFSGFMCGLSAFPLIFAGLPWEVVIIRSITLALAWGIWCKLFGNDNVEEYGRGAFVTMF
jgi:hypothetical protein